MEEIKRLLVETLQDFIQLEDVPPRLVRQAVRELCKMRVEPSREVILKYVQQILLPELNKHMMDNINAYRKSFGWGQVKKLLPYILSDYLANLRFNVYVRPLVDATRVDVIVEHGGKYLPILISTGTKERVVRYKMCRLRARGVNVHILTITREKVLREKCTDLVDINLIEHLIEEEGNIAIRFKIDRYEQKLFDLWRLFSRRGYIVFRSYIHNDYVFDMFAVGYSVIGVKKFTRSLIQSPQILRDNIRRIRDLIKQGLVDRVIIVTLAEVSSHLQQELQRSLRSRELECVSIAEA